MVYSLIHLRGAQGDISVLPGARIESSVPQERHKDRAGVPVSWVLIVVLIGWLIIKICNDGIVFLF
jgi:hypothetical protein